MFGLARPVCIYLLLIGLLGAAYPCRADQAVSVWQPQLSDCGFDSDQRLERAVSVSLPDSNLGTVISHLSTLSGVALTCDDDLRFRPITVYLPPTRLKDAMAELASFTMCEWWVVDDPSGYRLRKTSTLRQAEADMLARYVHFDFGPPEADPEMVKAITRRLREYWEALCVPKDQLVENYEDTDPWLAASQLNPLYQGLLPFLTGLSDEDIRLLAAGRLSLRVADLPAGVRNHLERTALGEFDKDHFYGPRPFHPKPGAVTQYRDWGERWNHAIISISWLASTESGSMCIRFDIPDTHMSMPVLPIRAKDGGRSIALDQIFRRTHPTPTVEQIKEKIARIAPIAKAEMQQQEREKSSKINNERLSFLRKTGADWSDKVLLDRRVIPWPEAGRSASFGEVLVSIADQSAMPLIADYVEDRDLVPPELTKEQTVREALERASRRWGSETGWSKPLGRFAIVGKEYITLSFAPPSSEFLRECEEAARGKQEATLEDFLSLAGDMDHIHAYMNLHPTRWQRASREFAPMLSYMDAPSLRRLLAGEEVAFGEIADQQRRFLVALAGAAYGRPRLTEADLAHATFKLLRLPNEGDCRRLGLLCEYHFPDDPTARQMLYDECPLSVPFDPPPPVKEKQPSPEPTPSRPPSDAPLLQTNWLYRGSIAYGEKQGVMLTNDSTGEMEIVEEGGSFRALVVSGITDTFVTLCDAIGDRHTLALRLRAPSEPDPSDLELDLSAPPLPGEAPPT